MHYLDTNILVYSVVYQDEQKLNTSQNLIQDLLKNKKLLLSPLSLQELVFTLSKLKQQTELIVKSFELFSSFCLGGRYGFEAN